MIRIPAVKKINQNFANFYKRLKEKRTIYLGQIQNKKKINKNKKRIKWENVLF